MFTSHIILFFHQAGYIVLHTFFILHDENVSLFTIHIAYRM